MGHRRFFHGERVDGLEFSVFGAEEEEEGDEFDEAETDGHGGNGAEAGWSPFVLLAKGGSGRQLNRGSDICARLWTMITVLC